MSGAFLQALCAAEAVTIGAPVLLVVAHPDDEVIGAGMRLPRLSDVRIVYVTDGAPADGRDAARLGFGSREAYARARATEAEAALALVGIDRSRMHFLGVVDQEAPMRVAEVAQELAGLLRAIRPAFVLTHPYEGGHPDHDATALAVRLALQQIATSCLSSPYPNPPPSSTGEGASAAIDRTPSLAERRGRVGVGTASSSPTLIEFASYHASGSPGVRVMQEFLPGHATVVTARLSEAEQALKRRMFACYATQEIVLRDFPVDRERFRASPAYDFARPPHTGPLLYEQIFAGWTWERWREATAGALAAHDIQGAF